MKSELPAEPALVGRDQEIALLTQHLESALNGKGNTVFICGEAGVGKTRLVNEFLNLAKKMGAEILSGWCLSEAAIPYFPFSEAFNSYISTTDDKKTKSVVTKQLGIIGWLKGPKSSKEHKALGLFLTPEIERDRTFEAVAAVLLELSAQEPIVLVLDDLHWADHLSLALLHYLSRKCRNSKLLIIGTYRPEELISSEEKKLHPLEETIFSMSREDLLNKMELGRLKRNVFPELLRSILRSSIDDEFVEELFDETEGNPLFAVETLNLLVDEGFLSENEGQWILTAPAEKMAVPSKIQGVITRRIARLEREERKMLDLASVFGQSFNSDIISRIMASDLASVLQMLVEVERRHRLIRSEDSTFKFTHHKIREVIYANLPGELRRICHLKVAGCLEQVLSERTSDEYLADIAFHYVKGEALEKAFEYLVRLGERAVKIHSSLQATQYLDTAIEATLKTPSLAKKDKLAQIHKLRGIAWLQQDERTKARDDFNLMLQNASDIGDKSVIAEAHYWLGSSFEAYFGEMTEAMEHLNTATEMARKTGNKSLEAWSLGSIGTALMWGTKPDTMDEGRMRLEESSGLAKEIGDKVTEADNLGMLGMYHNWKGEFSRANESVNKALQLDEEVGGTGMIFHLFCLGMVLGGSGDYSNAISTLKRCLQLARDSGRISTMCMVINTLGWIYHDLSNIELAIKYNSEALEVAEANQRSRASGAVPMSLLNLGMDYLGKNDYENAERYFRETIKLYPQHQVGWYRAESRILLGRGEISRANGDYPQALKFVEESLAISTKSDAKKYIAKGLKAKAEILAKMGEAERAMELMHHALKLAKEVGNPPILWQTHYSIGLLLEEGSHLQKANEHYSEALALIETTASKLNDASLAKTLLTCPYAEEVRAAYVRTKPTA